MRCVVLCLLGGLVAVVSFLPSCATRRHAVELSEERECVVESSEYDTTSTHKRVDEDEVMEWCVEVVREQLDSFGSVNRPPEKPVERWLISGRRSRHTVRVDTSFMAGRTISTVIESDTTKMHVDEEIARDSSRQLVWVLSCIMIVLSVVSVGLIVKH